MFDGRASGSRKRGEGGLKGGREGSEGGPTDRRPAFLGERAWKAKGSVFEGLGPRSERDMSC